MQTAETMRIGVAHVVTHSSKNREFQIGDRIVKYQNGHIGNVQAQGWIDADDVPEATLGMTCEIDTAWISARKGKLAAIAAELEAL